MSVPPQFRVTTTSHTPPQSMALDANVGALHSRSPWDYFHTLDSPMLVPTTHFHQSYSGEHLIRRDTNPWSFHNPYFWHANQAYGISAALSTSPHVDQQTQDNLLFWRPADAQVVPESFPSLSFPTMVNGMCRDDTTRETSNTPRGPWPNSDRQSLSPIIEPGTRNLSNHLNANQSLPSPSLTMHFPYPGAPNDQNAAEPFVPRHLPSHYPSPLHWFPHHPRSIEPPEPDTHFRFVPPQDPTISSCRRRAARAFEFGGVCLDEEEFVKSLTEASGRLDVFQCRWEENHSPCHLWIKGDKSCINVHIQRWHGGQPGGDKLEVECHWAGCEATMLKESIARHIVSIHLGEKWECQGCGKEAARYDVHRRHTVRSNLEVCRTSGALTTYSADVWVIDAHAALDSGARLRADV